MMDSRTVSRFALAGAGLATVGLATGLVAEVLPQADVGHAAHVEAVLGGVLLMAVAGVWRRRVRLGPQAEAWTFYTLTFGAYGHWLVQLLDAHWRHVGETAPSGTAMGLTLGVAVLLAAGMSLLLHGLVKGLGHSH